MKVYKCLKCGKEITENPHNYPEDKDTEKMWNGGVVFKMYAGYGSVLDGDMFIGALCDTCIDKLAIDNIIKYDGDYIFGNKEYIPLGGKNDRQRK